MSQFNHNQNQNQNTNNNGNYHTRRNLNHRGAPQYNAYGQAFVPEYAYTQAYQPQGFYQQDPGYYPGYPPAAGYPVAPVAGSPAGVAVAADHPHHAIHLTTQTGEKVDLKALKSQGSTPQATSPHISINRPVITPKAQAAALNTHQRTPSYTPAPAPAAPADPKALDVKNSFKAAVLAKLKAKKEAEAASKKADSTKPAETKTESKPVETVEPKKETEKPVEPKKEAPAPAVTETPKEETSKPQPEETKKEAEPVVEQPKEESKPEVKEEVKEPVKEEVKDEVKPQQVEEEQPKPAVVEESTKETPSETKEETTTTASKPVETSSSEITEEIKEVEEPTEEALPQRSLPTVSNFFGKLEKAELIKDPFSFKYPEGIVGPSPKLKENCKVPIRYDPGFLVQFIDKTKFFLDPEFKKSISFLLDNLESHEKGRGGGSGHFRGGFGQGSIPGIQGGQYSKSSSNLRRFGNSDPRSNSRQGSKRKGGSGRGNDRKSNRNRDREPAEPAEPAEPVKPLEKSANRWIPKSRLNKEAEVKYAPDGVTVLLSEEDINRKIKSLLNKLTLEFFTPISDSIIEIANQSQWEEDAGALKLVLAGIFDKATDEPHWSEMYARLCAKLCKDIKETVELAESGLRGGFLARRLLLSKCQQEYEKGWAENLPTNEDGSALEPEMMTDDYYRIAAAKRRGLGLVRLIGHLFVLRLLSPGVVRACVTKLVSDVDTPSEDIVENLIELLKTAGPTIDKTDGQEFMDIVFQKVSYMANKAKIPSRLQFTLLDLIELRNKRWEGGDADKGPKTITEIHQEEKRKQAEDQRARSERSRQKGGDSRSNSSRNSGWGNNRISDSDMKNVGKISSPKSSSDLGPQNNFQKARSRSNRFSSPVPESTPKPVAPLTAKETARAPSNSFSLLDGHNDDESESEEEQEAEAEAEPVKEEDEEEQKQEETKEEEKEEVVESEVKEESTSSETQQPTEETS